jgi:hypothetical protein
LGEDPLWIAVKSTTVLTKNQSISRGEYKLSPSGKFKIGLDPDGELVVIDIKSSSVAWSSGKNGAETCVFQQDGNFVCRDGLKRTTWATDTSGNAGARLTIDDAGVAAIMLGTSEIWTSDGSKNFGQDVITVIPSNPNSIEFPETVVLESGGRLMKGKYVSSPEGNYKIGINEEGNLLFQDNLSNTIWHANVQGGNEAVMQADGNFGTSYFCFFCLILCHTGRS